MKSALRAASSVRSTRTASYSQTGRELLFDLDRDPLELHDLLRDPDAEERVLPWRRRLIERLRRRPEGFTDGERMIAGRPHGKRTPGSAVHLRQEHAASAPVRGRP